MGRLIGQKDRMIVWTQQQDRKSGQPMGPGVPFELEGTDTVGQVKAKIQEKEGTPVAEQDLEFSGKKLDDDSLLVEEVVDFRPGAKRALGLTNNNFFRDRSTWFYLVGDRED